MYLCCCHILSAVCICWRSWESYCLAHWRWTLNTLMLFSTLVYTVSQLKWDQISSPFKYSVIQQKYVISTTLQNLIYNVQIPTKYTAWFLRYKSLKSGTWKRKFPTCERPLQTETVVQTWQMFTLLLIARNFFTSKHARFHLTIGVAAQFPWSRSSRLWSVGSAAAMPLPYHNPQRRPPEAVSDQRLSSFQSGHGWPSSETVAWWTVCLRPWKRRPFWVQTVTDEKLTVRLVCVTVSVSNWRSHVWNLRF